jgi:GDP-L-fucose synthase
VKIDSRIFVAGADTLPGAALLDLLRQRGYSRLVGTGDDAPDLTEPIEVDAFFADAEPEYVFLVAGKSGGIGLNRAYPADLMLHNLRTTINVVDSSQRAGVKKLLYLASCCAYPKLAPQPLKVESLTTGPMEPTSEAYATAKLAGWKLCDAYRRQYGCLFVTAFPANPFGPNDDFGPDSGHVIPALLRRAHDAKRRGDAELSVWGSGTPRREFIFSEDLADACLFTMQNFDREQPINLGAGTILSVAEVAQNIVDVVGYRGRLIFDSSKPDGAPLKALDSAELLSLGWKPSTGFRKGMAETYRWFLQHVVNEGAPNVCTAL